MLRSGEFAYPGIRPPVALAALDGSLHPGASQHATSLADGLMIMSQLSDEELKNIDHELDGITGSFSPKPCHRRFVCYVGFAFWDVLTLTLPECRELGEHDEIRVDRISPVDTVSLRAGTASSILKGAELRHFAGFLSRSLRESDYLWGRLDGAERLIDIVCDAARADFSLDPLDNKKIKNLAFRCILDAEEKHLQDKSLVPTIRAAIDRETGETAANSSPKTLAPSTPNTPL
jgi:hypothetical protein